MIYKAIYRINKECRLNPFKSTLLDLFLASESNMKWVSQSRITLEVGVARACLPEDCMRMDALAARIELLEKKIEDGIVTTSQRPAVEELAERMDALSAWIEARMTGVPFMQDVDPLAAAAEAEKCIIQAEARIDQSETPGDTQIVHTAPTGQSTGQADVQKELSTAPPDVQTGKSALQVNMPIKRNKRSTEAQIRQITVQADVQSEQSIMPTGMPTKQITQMAKAEVPTEPSPEESKALWEKALKLVRKEAPGIYSQLLQGRFEGIQGDAAHMVFPKEGEIYLNTLKLPVRLSQLEELLSEAAGKPMKCRLELERKTPAPKRTQEDTLQKVFDVFGRENVQVVDEPL